MAGINLEQKLTRRLADRQANAGDWEQWKDKTLASVAQGVTPQGGDTKYNIFTKDWGTAKDAPEIKGLSVRSPILNVAEAIGDFPRDYTHYENLLGTETGMRFLIQYSIAAIWLGNDVDPQVLSLLDVMDRIPKLRNRGAGGKGKDKGNVSRLMQQPVAIQAHLKNGVWHHMPTGREFPITDGQYGGEEDDSPIMALGHNLTRVLGVGNRANSWYEENPPPMRPKFPEHELAANPNNPQVATTMQAYVRAMRAWLKKFALEIIENDNWVLFWRGYLFTNGVVNFKQVFNNQSPLLQKWETDEKVPDTENVVVIDARNHKQLSVMTWGQLKDATTATGYGVNVPVGHMMQYLKDLGAALKRVGKGVVEEFRPYESIKLYLFNAICEMMLLQESLTYNQMLTATAQFWKTRLRNVRQVHTHPPTMVMLQDGTVDLNFHFESRPSTEGKPHNGYVKFIPEIGKVNFLDKVKELLGKAAKNIQRFFNKKVPPQILKGSDLRKMLVEVSCDCKDFKYRMSYANVKAGVTAPRGRTDNGQAPNITNPRQHPGFCKHILATVRYLTDDAEITIEKELSDEQLAALRADREQFMKDAMAAYDRMEAPAAEPEEEEVPEEVPVAPPEGVTRLAPPPKPTEPRQAPAPAAPTAPPAPPYSSSQ